MVRTISRSSYRRHPPVSRRCDLPQAWAPLQSMAQDPRHRDTLDICTLPRFLPPRRDPSTEVHHSRALPARVMLRPRTYHVPRRVTPSANSLVSFQPGAPTGLRPSELYLTEIAVASRRWLPLMRLAFRPLQQTLGLLLHRRLPEIGCREDKLVEQTN